MRHFLPYGRHCIDDDDVAAVAAVLKSDFLTGGPMVERFEQAFAAATGAADAVACNSGTAALHLAALAGDLGPGGAAIVPSVTFLATANAVAMTGADVVFADVDPDTGLITPQSFDEAIARARAAGVAVRAAIPVHLNGQVCDMRGLAQVAEAHGIALIEDACHALGETDIGATEFARAACFSTHPVKAIATGEGGVVTTADRATADRMRRLRNHGMVRDPSLLEDRTLSFGPDGANPWSYEMHEIGWNYRLPDIACALGLSQIRKLGPMIARRRDIARRYDALLAPLAPSVRPVPHGARPHGWHLYAILVDFNAIGMDRAAFMRALRSEGIGSQVHYIPVHRQPCYRRRHPDLMLPGAESYYARCLSIPFFPSMSDEDVERVAATIATVAAGGKPQ
jgi:UDP-4-amino-4,6-dideoxy-N-acetyl-beta-L-altrosamine transaminase